MALGLSARLLAGLRRALTFWRRSIQARVVASTVVLSAVVISVVGWFLLQQTRQGLLDHRVAAVVAEAGNETRDARARLAAASGTDLDYAAQQRDLVEPIIASGESRGFAVVLAGPVGSSENRIADGGAQFTPGLDTASVPVSLEQHFSRVAPTAWTYTNIRTVASPGTSPGATTGLPASDDAGSGGAPDRPGIVVGSQVRLPSNGLTYTLYYLFPLDEDRETLALVTRALLTAAVLLLVLVAGLTWLVTRQVVTPVRLARQVAERLAAGHLQERLRVSGEDDLARLAASFNQMASSLQRQIRRLEELSRVQRRFVSDVSHELRTPLTTVRMAGDVLHDARRSFDPVTARAAELLQVELDRFETLLADLLEISRFDAGAAVLLLVLVAGMTWLVTRQVVTPIRMARQVAERLASGQLQERLRVAGEDDLARLATSFNQMASNLQRQIRQLEELSRVQRRFVSDVSHELRTPLTTVRMASDVLHDARHEFDPVTARAAELLQTELDRFETLLVDLLEISRFDAGAAVLDAEDVNLVDVAHRVVDMTRPLAEQRGVEVRVVADEPCVAEGDVRRIERIVRNLVTNAIDHAECRDVEIFVGADAPSAAIAVRDHGVGLGPGESAMVFNRFWRADPARARTSGGTGLGLSISLEDTHLHGGWLQAWGRPGEGAQFRLTLPRRLGTQLRHSPLPLVPVDARETA